MASATGRQTARNRKRPGQEQQARIILDAAVELFGERGCKAVPVSDICKQAKVSRDTFYRCFPDKDALIDQLYQSSVNDHIEVVMKSWAMDYSNQAWLQEVCDKTIDAILSRHAIARFLFVEAADPDSYAHAAINKAYERVVRRIQRWCQQSGRGAPSKEYLMALLVATQWLVHNAINSGMKARDIAKAKEAAAQLFYAALSETVLGKA